MREIKFRAWHKGHGKKYPPSMLYDEKAGDCLRWLQEGQPIEDIMQFTGLKDKNGKEIYEGDVVYFYLEGTPEDDFGNAEIVFSDGSFCVKHKIGEFRIDKEEVFNEYPFFVIDFTQVEIIGNVYENPELLG